MNSMHTDTSCFERKHRMGGLLIICALLMSGFIQPALAEQKPIEWLGRPWELRYILYVSDHWSITAENAQERREKAGIKMLDRDWWELLFEPQAFFPSRDKWAQPEDGLSAVVIEFDRDGKVKTPHAAGASLYGKIDRILDVTLSEGGDVNKPRYDLGFWFMGLGDVSTHWAPGLCKASEMPNPFAKTELGTGYLYGPKFEPSPIFATFGCREWAYQLQHPNRPYIDITSYMNKKDDPDGSGTYVRELFGWSRFSDEPKPVIGKHEEDWYCFHECPGGDKPGLIPDIKAWAKKNGWPVPVRPTRIPVFPDPPAKSGTYPMTQKPISSSDRHKTPVQKISPSLDSRQEEFPDVPADIGC